MNANLINACIHIFFIFRIWKAAGLCTHILEGHSGAITSVSIINPRGTNTRYIYLALLIIYVSFNFMLDSTKKLSWRVPLKFLNSDMIFCYTCDFNFILLII